MSPRQSRLTAQEAGGGLLLALLHKSAAPRREVRSLAGKLSHFAGLVPRPRPFVEPLWAVFAAAPDAA
eukprot:15092744-Alexandrium_andersonii.AAC.1